MSYRVSLLAVAFATLAVTGAASAQCPPDCPVKGGGDTATDCLAELASDAVRLNSPFFNPNKPKPGKEIRCFDGDPGCDLDGVVNNECEFDVDLCLRNADPSLPGCTPADVDTVAIGGSTSAFPGLIGLQSAVDALLTATTNVCTSGQSVVVPLKATGSGFKAGKFKFKTLATAGATVDKDKFRMKCVPRGWPSHSYDANNRRSTPLDTGIDSTNVATLVEKWSFELPGFVGGKAISSSVTVGTKFVYTSAWNGKVYALDKKTGVVSWSYDTNSGGTNGVQSSVTLTADGRVLVGDSQGRVFCLDGKKGSLLWQASVGNEDPAAAHIWGSPTVANNRVLMGIASHNDAPCTRGTLVALDLDDGSELWRQYTVPENVCFSDTSDECSTNAECAPSACLLGNCDNQPQITCTDNTDCEAPGTCVTAGECWLNRSLSCSSNADCSALGSPCLVGNCNSNPTLSCTQNSDCPSTFLTPGQCRTNQCWRDQSISCSSNTDCPACVPGIGGGVTATAGTSPDGESVYMASVGCLSYPSIGNSDSMFKLDADTGAIDWVYRTEAPEQFRWFASGPTYHDYGFLNGPILADVDDGIGGTVPVAVAGGKDGTLYAVNQNTGLFEWSNVLAPAPDFAGFGLFNGALAYDLETDQFFAALFDIDTYSALDDHLLSFNGLDGSVGWSDQIGSSWSSVTVANDVLYAGTQGGSTLLAYDKADGTLLHTFTVPSGTVTGGVAVEDGVLYIPYGIIFGSGEPKGGVLALALPEAP